MGISISDGRKIEISLICLQEQLELSIKAALPKFELQSPKNKIIRSHQRYRPSMKSLTTVSIIIPGIFEPKIQIRPTHLQTWTIELIFGVRLAEW